MKKRKKIIIGMLAGFLLIPCITGTHNKEVNKETVQDVMKKETMSWAEEKEGLTEKEQSKRLEEIKEEARDNNVPERVISLIDQNDETVDFVRNYSEKHLNEPAKAIDEKEVESGIPLLLQWDERWGYMSYGKGTIANCGCGPTCVSMVITGMTGDLTVTPYAVAQYSEQHGLIDENDNTYWQLMVDMPEEYGIKVEETSLNESQVVQELGEGHPIICSMGPGDFTDAGHFIVLTDYQDGMVSVCDPFSIEKSRRNWKYEEIEEQIIQMWIYEK